MDPGCALSVTTFGAQAAFLAKHRKVISLDQLCESIELGRALPRGSVVITFDDGYLDTLTVAAPILASYDLPATVYLATGYITQGETQWADRLYTALRARTRNALSLDGSVPEPELDSPQKAAAAYEYVSGRLLSSTWDERKLLLERIEAELVPDEKAPRLTMNWEDVRELVRRYPNWEVGVHTRTHLDLSAHPSHAEEEIEQSHQDVKTHLGRSPRHFSFPYGRFVDTAATTLLRLGFRSAARTDPVIRVDPDTDPFALPRCQAPRRLSRLSFCTSGAYPDLSLAVCGRAAMP